MSAPNKEHLRYGEARDWLHREGISERQFLKWIELRIIKPKQFVPGWKFYCTSQIQQVLRDGNRENKQDE